MALRVGNSRITAEITAFFGSLFLVGSIFYTGLKVRDYKAEISKEKELFAAINGYLAYLLKFGYPVFIGIWTDVTAVIGIKATSKQRPRSPCKISTFLLFSTILVIAQIFFIYDFSGYLKQVRADVGTDSCETRNQSFWTSCYVRVFTLGILLTVAVVILALSCWCWLCSYCSLCKGRLVQSVIESEPQAACQSNADNDLALEQYPGITMVAEIHPGGTPSTGETALYPSLSSASNATDTPSPNTNRPAKKVSGTRKKKLPH